MADLDSRATGNMRENAQNAEQTKVIRNTNRFPLDYSHPTSHRYGDIDIFYHYFGERGDTLPLRTGHSVRTFTMSSPNEIDIYMRKQFLHIPMKAIYPRTWDEVLYPLPVDGDTAPLDGRANFPIVNYLRALVSTAEHIKDNLTDGNFGLFMLVLDAISNVVSDGSLFAKVNQHYSDLVSVRYSFGDADSPVFSFDRFISTFYSDIGRALRDSVIHFREDPIEGFGEVSVWYGDINSPYRPTDDLSNTISTWHELHDLIQARNYDFSLSEDILSFSSFNISFFLAPVPSSYINIEPIIAYQLCAAQFYTNDRVDNIYSANTFRNYIQYLQSEALVDSDRFIFNDVEYLYDIFSQHQFDRLVDNLSNFEISSVRAKLAPLNQMFVFRRSLRFGDYFLGARVRPLAVGESSIPVTNDSVMVEDITKSAALQRLRYNINVLGRKINNQLQGLIPGLAPTTPDDIPTSIASQDFNIGKDSDEVENTGAAQIDPSNPLAITTHLNSGASDFAFKIQITEPCIILGLVSFSVPLVYSKTIDRFAFHNDRFDMFIPQMQFIGDQEIFRKELYGLSALSPDLPFAYNQRYSEYKQRYSHASGMFCDFLDSWEMIPDNNRGYFSMFGFKLDSVFSHSSPSEFDRFYKSTLGNSLADYAHFIVKHYNTSTPTRAMAWNPMPLL